MNPIIKKILVTYIPQLFDGKIEPGAINTSTGVPSVDATRIRSVNFTPVHGGRTYNITNNMGYTDVRIYRYDSTQAYIGVTYQTPSNGVFTLLPSVSYIKFRYAGTDLNTKVHIRNGSPAKF